MKVTLLFEELLSFSFQWVSEITQNRHKIADTCYPDVWRACTEFSLTMYAHTVSLVQFFEDYIYFSLSNIKSNFSHRWMTEKEEDSIQLRLLYSDWSLKSKKTTKGELIASWQQIFFFVVSEIVGFLNFSPVSSVPILVGQLEMTSTLEVRRKKSRFWKL